jgi:hypothetical protein
MRFSKYLAMATMFAVVVGGLGVPTFFALASSTSTFNQVIGGGTLVTDIVDASYVTVANPSVTMAATTFSFAQQTTTGTFGTADEQIYVSNPDAADAGWALSMAAANPTDMWDSAGTDFDFNGASSAGQMTVDASGGTLAKATCLACTTDNISQGSSAAFNQGTVNSVTLLDAAAASDDIGNWTLQGVGISQTIPAEQPAASDYHIHMVLTVAAK